MEQLPVFSQKQVIEWYKLKVAKQQREKMSTLSAFTMVIKAILNMVQNALQMLLQK